MQEDGGGRRERERCKKIRWTLRKGRNRGIDVRDGE
jgi:hypothetical protein